MGDKNEVPFGIMLACRILAVLGILFLVGGAFTIMLRYQFAGAILLFIGVVDLSMSVILPRLAARQTPPQP